MKPTNSIISMINGIECSVMRQTFLALQQDENATNEQLVKDSENWNSYLEIYCTIFCNTHKDIPIQ